MSSDPDDLTALVAAASRALRDVAHPIRDAAHHVPNAPGLYAISGSPTAWAETGLVQPHDDDVLYVGKSESSLVTRDLRSHFAVDATRPARTGGSTVRRSFAALLSERLQLQARPRDRAMNPKYFASYALTPDSDDRLTAWMHRELRIAVWQAPQPMSVPLVLVERAVLAAWAPPVNLKDVPSPSRVLVEARRRMAAEAAAWAASHRTGGS